MLRLRLTERHRGGPNHRGSVGLDRGCRFPADSCCPRSPAQTKPARVIAHRVHGCVRGASAPRTPRPRRHGRGSFSGRRTAASMSHTGGFVPSRAAASRQGPAAGPGAGPAAAAGAATRGWERPRRRPSGAAELRGPRGGRLRAQPSPGAVCSGRPLPRWARPRSRPAAATAPSARQRPGCPLPSSGRGAKPRCCHGRTRLTCGVVPGRCLLQAGHAFWLGCPPPDSSAACLTDRSPRG